MNRIHLKTFFRHETTEVAREKLETRGEVGDPTSTNGESFAAAKSAAVVERKVLI